MCKRNIKGHHDSSTVSNSQVSTPTPSLYRYDQEVVQVTFAHRVAPSCQEAWEM